MLQYAMVWQRSVLKQSPVIRRMALWKTVSGGFSVAVGACMDTTLSKSKTDRIEKKLPYSI